MDWRFFSVAICGVFWCGGGLWSGIGSVGRIWAFDTLGLAASGEPFDLALVVQSYKNIPFTLTPFSLSSVYWTFVYLRSKNSIS